MSQAREKKSAPRKRAAAAGARGKPPATRGKAAEADAPTPRRTAAKSESKGLLSRMAIEVRWRDLDTFNHVNNANYLTYIEEARVRWLQSLSGPWVDETSAPVLAAVQLNYRRPIEWPCAVVVELYVEKLGNSSLTLGHRIVADQDASVVYCDGHSIMVWIERQGGKPTPLPGPVRAACGG